MRFRASTNQETLPIINFQRKLSLRRRGRLTLRRGIANGGGCYVAKLRIGTLGGEPHELDRGGGDKANRVFINPNDGLNMLGFPANKVERYCAVC